MVYSSNLYDKSKYPVTDLYFANQIYNGALTSMMSATSNYGGIGIRNFPVKPGLTYTFHAPTIALLGDYVFNNVTYTNPILGNVQTLWFTDSSGIVLSHIANNSNNNYLYKAWINNVESSITPYQFNSNIFKLNNGTTVGSDTITFTVVSEEVAYVTIQLGVNQFKPYQLCNDFMGQGRLSKETYTYFEDNVLINLGEVVLDYEEYYENEETRIITTSSISELEKSFTPVTIYSTNLFDPSYNTYNHKYVSNGWSTKLNIYSYNMSAAFYWEVPNIGAYTFSLNGPYSYGNKTFNGLNAVWFLNAAGELVNYFYISSNYFNNHTEHPTNYNPNAVTSNFDKTHNNTFTFEIFDETIHHVIFTLYDGANNAGLWTTYQPSTGLTDDEYNFICKSIQINSGNKKLPFESYDNITTVRMLNSDLIYGLNEKLDYIDNEIKNFEASVEELVKDITTSQTNLNKPILLQTTETNIYIRMNDFSDDKALLYDVQRESSNNKYINFSAMYTCNKTSLDLSTIGKTTFKSAGDDICPLNIMGTYIGANHGFNCRHDIVCTHDKTILDIGSIWQNNNNQLVLSRVLDNKLEFLPYNTTMMSTGVMGYVNIDTSLPLQHVSGAMNTSDITIDSLTKTLAWLCFNHYDISLLIDGQQVALDAGLSISSDRIELIKSYDIISIPAMINYLIENAGNNDNESLHSEDITGAYCRYSLNYQFNRNGSVSVYASIYPYMDLNIGYIGLVQSQAVTPTYRYIPDTIYDDIALYTGDATINFTKSTWNQSDKAPYRYFEFNASDNYTIGMALGYDPTIGIGEPSKRLAKLTSHAGMYYTSRKMYPALIQGGTLKTGEYIDALAVRIPIVKYDDDIFSICWYWRFDDIIIWIDILGKLQIDKFILLPSYMNGYKVQIEDSSDVFTPNTIIFDNRLKIYSESNTGYLVLRLYK